MSWMLTVIRSSIGKKYIMAGTGACLGFFLFAHLAGNALSFRGKDTFNAYASHLHALGFPLHLLEGILALVFLVHILIAINLYIENLSARPNRYAVQGENRNWSAWSMPYTGALILGFLLVHLANFHFAAKTLSPSEQVRTVLSNPPLAAFYLFSVSALTLHASHGLWSIFQSLGVNHPKYNPFLRIGSLFTALFIGTIFMLIPLLVLTTDRFLQ